MYIKMENVKRKKKLTHNVDKGSKDAHTHTQTEDLASLTLNKNKEINSLKLSLFLLLSHQFGLNTYLDWTTQCFHVLKGDNIV